MKLVKFDACNCVYAEDQPEYIKMPAHRAADGTVTTCWHLGFWDRVRVLVTGRVWLQLLTFNKPVQPQLLHSSLPALGPDAAAAAPAKPTRVRKWCRQCALITWMTTVGDDPFVLKCCGCNTVVYVGGAAERKA